MYSLRVHVWIFLGLLAAVILLAMAGNLLAAEGFQPMLDRIQLPLRILFFGLVLALAFSFIPVMVKLVLGFQVKANAELPVVRNVAALQNKIIWGFWILLALGLAVALPAAIQDNFFGSASTPAAAADLGPSQGTLTAAPGMEVADMLAETTLKLQGGDKPNLPFAGGAVFDFRVAGTDTVFGNAATTSSPWRARIPVASRRSPSAPRPARCRGPSSTRPMRRRGASWRRKGGSPVTRSIRPPRTSSSMVGPRAGLKAGPG
jgi:hypothetical protein